MPVFDFERPVPLMPFYLLVTLLYSSSVYGRRPQSLHVFSVPFQISDELAQGIILGVGEFVLCQDLRLHSNHF